MFRRRKKTPEIPTIEQVAAERERLQHGSRFRSTVRSTVGILLVVAALAILVSTLLLPVLQVYGSSMTPVLEDGEVVVLTKEKDFETGDIIAFYYNNKILVKRVIAGPGDWVDIDVDGNVYVNEKPLDEPYLTERSLGECDIELPYQVPDKAFFVMGDHRSVSIDSRSSIIGCIRTDQIAGRVFLRVWPLKRLTFF